MTTSTETHAGHSGPAAPRRILLKLSGEALMGEQEYGIDPKFATFLAKQLQLIRDEGVEMGLVIGGGNIFRGVSGVARGLSRVSGDYMGMLATIINALAMQDVLVRQGIPAEIFTPFEMPAFAQRFNAAQVNLTLNKNVVTIFAGGTGNPYFSTDSAAALRAAEIGANMLLKATKVDGVYDKDPMKFPDAVMYPKLNYQEVLERNLKVMDATAVALCRDVGMPIFVFNLLKEGNIARIAHGDTSFGTMVR
ncbi:MAG: UMP kinase [Candidatus Wallbacteria bacterium]|nr:UMP kinase [Candidatus Wallbacteria bacterium]